MNSLLVCLQLASILAIMPLETPPIVTVESRVITENAQTVLALTLNLPRGWHATANPAGDETLIPTTVTIEPLDGVNIVEISYPKGERVGVPWADKPIFVYHDEAEIRVRLRVAPEAEQKTLRGNVRVQLCDDKVCLPPRNISFETTLEPRSEIVAPTENLSHPSSEPENFVEKLLRERGWTLAFIAIFFGGLALNLTPCVYPMMAVTISYFGGAQKNDGSPAFPRALAYFFGIVLTYSALGLVAASTGALFGAWLQNPIVLGFVAVVILALALSMFGLYELRPPQFLMQKATHLSSKAGFVGVFFLGAVVGIIAAPCIGPFVVALLAFVGQRGDPWLGWWLFFAMAVGLGAPYLILGTFSGLLRKLPKSGTWMIWVERALGVALVLVAVWIAKPIWATSAPKLQADGIAWEPFSVEKLQQATAKKQHVIVDFYADWCIPCHEMDKKTFSNARVIEKSREFVMLKADLTRTGTPEVEKLARQFNIVGVPTTIFIGPDGAERKQLRLVGFVPPDEFLQVMDNALAK
jgi:thiol:disulfide interchange protein DsbD